MPSIRFQVDNSEVKRLIGTEIPASIQSALAAIAADVESYGPFLAGAVIAEAAESDTNFPREYAQHLTDVASDLVEVYAYPAGASVVVTVNLDSLGDVADLVMATHYHARAADNELIELPYGGQRLKNIKEKREAYFEINVKGTELESFTYDARVSFWYSIGKAPEWLFLNWGESHMGVSPHPILENIEALITNRVEQEAYTLIDTAIERTGIYGTYRSRAGQFTTPNKEVLIKGNISYDPRSKRFRGAGGQYISQSDI